MNQEHKADVIDRGTIQAVERAQIDAQIATAHAYPKHQPGMLSEVKEAMLSFATLDEETAQGIFYTLPRGRKVIQGPSIRMAEIAVTCYGNIRDSARVIDVVAEGEAPHVLVQAVCHDLERNVAVSIEKRRRIIPKKDYKTGEYKPIDEDDINLAVNACTAIAYRDAAFKIIPLALIKPVVAAAKKVAIGDIKSLGATREKCIDKLNQMGVPTDRILAVVNCRKIEDIGQSELEMLFGLGTALKDGQTTIEEAFPYVLEDESRPKGVKGVKDRLSKSKDQEPAEPSEPEDTKTQEPSEESPWEDERDALFVCVNGHRFVAPIKNPNQKRGRPKMVCPCPGCYSDDYDPVPEMNDTIKPG